MKVNYGFERAQRKRAKDLKKQEKLRRREEETAKRKALKASQPGDDSDGAPESDPQPPSGPLAAGDE